MCSKEFHFRQQAINFVTNYHARIQIRMILKFSFIKYFLID